MWCMCGEVGEAGDGSDVSCRLGMPVGTKS